MCRTQMYMADQAPVDDEIRSVALPFAEKPMNLNGELVGDVGKHLDAGGSIWCLCVCLCV